MKDFQFHQFAWKERFFTYYFDFNKRDRQKKRISQSIAVFFVPHAYIAPIVSIFGHHFETLYGFMLTALFSYFDKWDFCKKKTLL